MLTWKDCDKDGVEIVVRSGRGVVRSVTPLGERKDPNDYLSFDRFRVEIAVEPEQASARVLRVSIAPQVEGGSPLLPAVIEALRTESPVAFTIDFVRLPHIPGNLPVDILDMSRDMSAQLRALEMAPDLAELDDAKTGNNVETVFRNI